jgi:hypothetical protein
MENESRDERLDMLFITSEGELQENTFYGRRPQTIIGVYCCLGALFFCHFSP